MLASLWFPVETHPKRVPSEKDRSTWEMTRLDPHRPQPGVVGVPSIVGWFKGKPTGEQPFWGPHARFAWSSGYARSRTSLSLDPLPQGQLEKPPPGTSGLVRSLGHQIPRTNSTPRSAWNAEVLRSKPQGQPGGQRHDDAGIPQAQLRRRLRVVGSGFRDQAGSSQTFFARQTTAPEGKRGSSGPLEQMQNPLVIDSL